MNDKIQHWKDTTWQIRPSLDMPELDPEAVQFAVLDSDPIELYRTSLKQNGDRFRKEVAHEEDSEQQELQKRAQMTGTWDLLFKATTGDQIYLLVPSRSKRSESMARAFVISSNDSAGKKWLTTKVAYHHERPICWCIQVDTAIGKSVQVELGKENAFDVEKCYDGIMSMN